MAKACCVCGDATDKQDNLLFTCKGHGCDVVVHQACYGILSVPGGQWFCRKCESQERAARVRCELCPKKEGALKRTDSGGWAHVVCALYIPEVTFLNNTKMEPIITSKLPRERFSKACYICEQKGQESHASYGAVMSCHKSSCRMAFHVTCAQKERLLCEEEDSREPGSLVYCGYCSNHYKKMMQKKTKQNLRKHSTTPTSTVAPPLPMVTTLTTSHHPSPHSSTSSYPPFPSSPTPPHKNMSDPLAPPPAPSTSSHGDHTRLQKAHQTGHASHANRQRNKDHDRKDKDSGPPSHKRLSVDAPIPPAKRKNRRRKLSSSNESSTSEAPSNSSDFVQGSHPLEPAASLGALREGGGGGGRRGDGGGGGGVQGAGYPKMDGASSHSISPVNAVETAPPSNRGKRTSTTESRVGGPPLSLQELLETQWQQTAQFILDQAGRQNNAGVMLEHLHKLQSENRGMQSRIMELASQREFYIAMNTRLRQTLADSTANPLPNGLQASGVTTSDGAGLGNPPPPLPMSSPEFHRSASGERASLPSPSPSLPAPSSVGSLSKQDQESLLHAHFLASSLPGSYPTPPLVTTQQTQSHPAPPPPNSAHHHSVRNSESPGFRHEQCSSVPPLPLGHTLDHAPYIPRLHDHSQHLEDVRTNALLQGHTPRSHTPLTHHNTVLQSPVPMSSYSPSIPITMSEVDTLIGEHPRSTHQTH